MLLKFGIKPGRDDHQNHIELLSVSEFMKKGASRKADLLIVDEIHELIKKPMVWLMLSLFTQEGENVLLLSATPVRHLKEDYLKLLQLIDPKTYESVDPEQFDRILGRQKKIMNLVLDANGSLDEMAVALPEGDEELLEEYFEEIAEAFDGIEEATDDRTLKELRETIDYSAKDHGIQQMRRIIAYLAETYQVEKNILKNRRRQLEKDEDNEIHLGKRHLIELPYQMYTQTKSAEYNAYRELLNWVNEKDLTSDRLLGEVSHLFQMFFSSSWAYLNALKKHKDSLQIPESLLAKARKWIDSDEQTIKRFPNVLHNPGFYSREANSRLFKAVNFLDQELGNEKAVVFVSDPATFDGYRRAFAGVFGPEKIAFFDSSQNTASLEDNSYRFQNDPACQILLSDPSGGEGRNFQNASYILHVDLPWDAAKIEQRIGRLDRLERNQNKLDIYSAVPYAEDTLEAGMFTFWKKGLHIFENSLSGLEIVMGTIKEKLNEVIRNDLMTGIFDVFDGMNDLTEKLILEVRKEQSFDILSTTYSEMNEELDQELRNYLAREDDVYAGALLSWASQAGFRGQRDLNHNGYFTFNESWFSLNSAKKALMIPPEWKKYLERPENIYLQQVLARFQKSQTNSIRGTFLRWKAVQNDFVHFFAPGDQLFDAITDNAIHSAKGQCAAIRIRSNFSWKGFFMIWRAVPNELPLLQAGTPVSVLAQYRHYLYSDLIIVPYAIENPNEMTDEQMKRFLKLWCDNGNRKNSEHLGKREKQQKVINGETVKVSEMELFRLRNPAGQWSKRVDEARAETLKFASDLVRKHSRIGAAQRELERRLSSQYARQLHYGLSFDLEGTEKENEMIVNALKRPRLILDSAIYVEVEEIKSDHDEERN